MRKMLMGPRGPIAVSYSPMVADNVPAMLSPGEGVLNNGAMSQPGMSSWLQQANLQGAQRMADGGVVRPMPGGGAPGTGGMDMGAGDYEMVRQMLLRLLPMLLGMNGSEAFSGQDAGAAGAPQHFAWGGQVRPQSGGFARAPQASPAGPATVGATPRAGAAPAGMYGTLTNSGIFGGPRSIGAAPGGGLQPLPSAPAPAAPAVDPNAWGQAPSAGPNMNLGNWNINQQLQNLLGQYGNAGSFGPNGNPQLLASLQKGALGTADALRQRAQTAADMGGLDAGQRASYLMQNDLNSTGSVANTLNSAQSGMLQAQDKFGKDLFGTANSQAFQDYLARLAYEHQRLLGG